jgi:DnaJ-class molecular chaperone
MSKRITLKLHVPEEHTRRTRKRRCHSCGGDGFIGYEDPEYPLMRCGYCNGSGVVSKRVATQHKKSLLRPLTWELPFYP